MYGVFFMSESMRLEGVKDRSIHLFATYFDAEQWVFDRFVEAGRIRIDGDGYLVDGDQFELLSDAIDRAQMTCGGLEFLHVFPVVMHA